MTVLSSVELARSTLRQGIDERVRSAGTTAEVQTIEEWLSKEMDRVLGAGSGKTKNMLPNGNIVDSLPRNSHLNDDSRRILTSRLYTLVNGRIMEVMNSFEERSFPVSLPQHPAIRTSNEPRTPAKKTVR